MDFAKLDMDQAREVLSKHPVALLPMGAVEVHGPHLPLDTDNILAVGVARKVAEKHGNAIVLPPISYGQVWSLRDFAGTLSVSNEVLIGMIADIGRSLYKHGVKVMAMVNGHMGNLVAMKEAARVLYEECDLKVLYLTYPGVGKVIDEVCSSNRPHPVYFHACEIETSYMLYVAPEEVKMEKAIRDIPEFPIDFDVTTVPWKQITNSAVLGDATLATREKGQAIIDAAVDNILALIHKVEGDL